MPQRATLWATTCKLLVWVILGLATRPAAAQMAYGLFSERYGGYSLVKFEVATPGTFTSVVRIAALGNVNAALVGLDVRPATGEVFALGYLPASSEAQLYKLNPASGALATIGPPLTLGLGTANYTAIGFDFDPTTDRVRVTSANRVNYRLNPNTGALEATDGLLTYASTDVNAGQTPGVGSSAHTNSYLGATATTLYNIDEPYSRLVSQTPATSGTLRTAASLIQGTALGPLITSSPTVYTDFDIYYNPVTGTNIGYISHVVSGSIMTSYLYAIDLTTWVLTYVGSFGSTALGTMSVVSDIALIPGTALAAHPTALATSLTLYPNPASSSARLSFTLPHAAHVELTVTDALGRTLDQVDAGQLAPGVQSVSWNRHGQRAGVYFFCLRFDGQPAGTRRAVLTE